MEQSRPPNTFYNVRRPRSVSYRNRSRPVPAHASAVGNSSSITPTGRPHTGVTAPSTSDYYRPRQDLFDHPAGFSPLTAEEQFEDQPDDYGLDETPTSIVDRGLESSTSYTQHFAAASNINDIVPMLQQQQAMLLQVLDQQQSFKEKQMEFEHKLTEMEDRFSTGIEQLQASGDNSNSQGEPATKYRVPRQLTVRLFILL